MWIITLGWKMRYCYYIILYCTGDFSLMITVKCQKEVGSPEVTLQIFYSNIDDLDLRGLGMLGLTSAFLFDVVEHFQSVFEWM